MKLFLAITIALLPLVASAGSVEQETKVIDSFIASLDSNPQLSDENREKVVATVKELRDDEYNRTLSITEGLREIYPDFRTALESMGEEDLTPAITALSKLSKSEDPFLATEATFYLAQAYSFAEQYETAMPILKDLVNKPDATVQVGDATFLLGVAQARTLRRKDAIETLHKFEKENPNAPERMRIAAWRQREQLQMLEDGSLADVYDRMDFSRRHLILENSGKEPQTEQEKIVAMLTKLIKQAEEQECNCSGQGQGQGKQAKKGEGEGQGKNTNGGGGSKQPNRKVVRTFNDGPQSPWSKLRDRKRDPAYSAIKEKFPARYQQLIEQYYKSFENEGS